MMNMRFWRSTLALVAVSGMMQSVGHPAQAQLSAGELLRIEQRLKELGYMSSAADGVVDQETVDGVIGFQKNHGLTADGKMNQTERMLLFSSAARKVDGTSAAPQQAAATPQAVAPQTQAPATPVAAPSPQPATVNASPMGAWYGEMTCQVRRRDMPAETEFTISTRANGVLEMVMTIGTETSMGNGTTETVYVGEPTPQGIRFVVEKVVRGAIFGNNRNTNQELLFDPKTGRMTMPDNCETFTARRQQQPDPRLIATVPIPPNGGTYFASAPGRARCEALINWADRANKEFPGRDFYRQNKPGDDWILIKLFADDDFIPVFGQPYDAMAFDQRSKISQEARKCRNDPFTRNRMSTYFAAADRVMGDNPERQLTSNGYSSTVFAIRQIRAVRNEVRALTSGTAQALPGESFVQTVQRLKTVRIRSAKSNGRLWPSESGAIGSGIDTFLERLAVQEATVFLRDLVSVTDPEQGLKKIEIHNRKRADETYFARYLKGQNAKSLEQQMKTLQQKFANSKVAPYLARASKAPSTFLGAVELNALMLEVRKVGTLPDANKKKLTAQIEKQRDVRIEAYLETALAEVKGLPPTLQGLTQETKWLSKFQRETAKLEVLSPIKAAREQVIAGREARLEAALPEFEEKLAALSSPEDIDALLASYLALKSDERLPIALEYQLTAELAK